MTPSQVNDLKEVITVINASNPPSPPAPPMPPPSPYINAAISGALLSTFFVPTALPPLPAVATNASDTRRRSLLEVVDSDALSSDSDAALFPEQVSLPQPSLTFPNLLSRSSSALPRAGEPPAYLPTSLSIYLQDLPGISPPPSPPHASHHLPFFR